MAEASFLFVTIDANDAEEVAAFWSALLGTEVDEAFDDGRFIFLQGRDDLPVLCVQRVPEPKVGKNRSHLDVHPPLEKGVPALVEELVALGGRRVGEPVVDLLDEIDVWWQVMTDPEGNELDVVADPGHPRP